MCDYPVSIITQKDILFINRMNLYFREGFSSKGFPMILRRNENPLLVCGHKHRTLPIEGSKRVCPSALGGSSASLSEAEERAGIASGIVVLKG